MKFFVYNAPVGDSQLLREDGVWISKVESNPLYQEFLAWVEEGNEPESWEPEEWTGE
jgi:hypothetical protein